MRSTTSTSSSSTPHESDPVPDRDVTRRDVNRDAPGRPRTKLRGARRRRPARPRIGNGNRNRVCRAYRPCISSVGDISLVGLRPAGRLVESPKSHLKSRKSAKRYAFRRPPPIPACAAELSPYTGGWPLGASLSSCASSSSRRRLRHRSRRLRRSFCRLRSRHRLRRPS